MTEVKKLRGFLRAEEEEEDEEDENRVREWEEGLPSLADLISLSQCLISPQLASAFSITSPTPSPARSSADVALASLATFSSLCGPPNNYTDLTPVSATPPAPPGHASGIDDTCLDHIGSYGGISSHDRLYGEIGSSLDAQKKVSVVDTPLQENDNPQGADDEKSRRRGRDSSQPHPADIGSHGFGSMLQPTEVDGDEQECKGGKNAEHDEDDCMQMNIRRPCTTEGSDAPTRVDALEETEEAESNPSPADNSNGEASARTLKRPRLVWTPELHKRFVDAVTHLGVRTAVPKTIMQLMNVEGLTRENVASHLQKYRLYLKRMQGLSSDLPMSTDLLFATGPLPGNLPAPGRFQPVVPAHVKDVNQVPFIASPNPVSLSRGYGPGVMPGPSLSMDPYAYNLFTRPPHRNAPGDTLDVHRVMQHSDGMHYTPRN